MTGMRAEGRYTRWTVTGPALTADILGSKFQLQAFPEQGEVHFAGTRLSPDEARLYGVRLIEAAALADGDAAVRQDGAVR